MLRMRVCLFPGQNKEGFQFLCLQPDYAYSQVLLYLCTGRSYAKLVKGFEHGGS